MTTTGVNTISTKTYRDKYRLANLDAILRNALVAEKVCDVDRSGSKTIQNPYGSQAAAQVSTLTGTYRVDDYTTTDDTLTVNVEIKVAEQVYDFEETLARFDLFANRADEQAYAVAAAVDTFVINNLCEDGTGTYTTPVGGFTTAANLNIIMSNLISKVAGFAQTYKGLFLIVENTDITGIIQAQATNGFSFADAALNNGWMTAYMGVDIYVVRSGTFTDATQAGITWTNSGHRVFGVKNVATYAQPQGIKFEEKGVSGKTGMEVVTYCYIGFKLWAINVGLVVDITLA